MFWSSSRTATQMLIIASLWQFSWIIKSKCYHILCVSLPFMTQTPNGLKNDFYCLVQKVFRPNVTSIFEQQQLFVCIYYIIPNKFKMNIVNFIASRFFLLSSIKIVMKMFWQPLIIGMSTNSVFHFKINNFIWFDCAMTQNRLWPMYKENDVWQSVQPTTLWTTLTKS